MDNEVRAALLDIKDRVFAAITSVNEHRCAQNAVLAFLIQELSSGKPFSKRALFEQLEDAISFIRQDNPDSGELQAMTLLYEFLREATGGSTDVQSKESLRSNAEEKRDKAIRPRAKQAKRRANVKHRS